MMNEPKREEGSFLDSVFRDGTKNPDASSPLDTVKAFFNTFFAFGAGAAVLNIAGNIGGELQQGMSTLLSNSQSGGGFDLGDGEAPEFAMATPANNLNVAQTFRMPGRS